MDEESTTLRRPAFLRSIRKHTPLEYLHVTLGFIVFCLLSGCAYLINDLQDVENDQRHPKKRFRPIASGALPVSIARGFAYLVPPFTLALAYFFIGGRFAAVAVVYIIVTLAYSLVLKHVVLVDVLVLAAGYVLRAVAGGYAIGVTSSEWLLLCTLLLALFLGLVKRRSELIAQGSASGNPQNPRGIQCSDAGSDGGPIVASTCLMAYALYTFYSQTGQHRPYLMATIPFVIYGLFRYLLLAHRGEGESPETILLTDRPLLINTAFWAITALLAIVYSHR